MPEHIRIRGGSGLGDAIYVQSIARHLIERGHNIEACSNYPDVFRPLNGRCIASPFRRDNVDRVAHYSRRLLATQETTQFQDCCIQAGIREPVDLRLDWDAENVDLVLRIRQAARGKSVIVVLMPRAPMGRDDGYGIELLSDCKAIQRVIDHLCGTAFLVQVGCGDALFEFDGLDLDLRNRTSVCDLIDVVHGAADGCLGYVSSMIPLAESLGKQALMVWARSGLNCGHGGIAARTPRKVIHRPDLVRHVIDDCTADELERASDALLEQVRSPALV